MKKPLLAGLMAVTLLSSCGKVRDSRINPLNWFGNSREEAVAIVVPEDGVFDGRPMVTQVLSMKVERIPGGALISATGLPQTQGYWDAELVPENNEAPVDGVLTYQFRSNPPIKRLPAGTQQSREVTVGLFASDQTLQGVRVIVIKGSANQRSSRR